MVGIGKIWVTSEDSTGKEIEERRGISVSRPGSRRIIVGAAGGGRLGAIPLLILKSKCVTSHSQETPPLKVKEGGEDGRRVRGGIRKVLCK